MIIKSFVECFKKLHRYEVTVYKHTGNTANTLMLCGSDWIHFRQWAKKTRQIYTQSKYPRECDGLHIAYNTDPQKMREVRTHTFYVSSSLFFTYTIIHKVAFMARPTTKGYYFTCYMVFWANWEMTALPLCIFNYFIPCYYI